MKLPRPSEALVGTMAGVTVSLLLVFSEFQRVRRLIDTSMPVGRAELRDETAAALLSLGPAVLSALFATLVLLRFRSVPIRLGLGIPLSVALGFAGAIPIYLFSYIDIPAEEASHFWVEIPRAYLFASLLSATVAVFVSSATHYLRRAPLTRSQLPSAEA